MEISSIEQEVSDIDWFAIDNEYNIAHFASAGGRLPMSVSISVEDNNLLNDYFQSFNETYNAFVINPNFRLPKDIQTPEQQVRYFRTFVFYATRGLYSFNRNEVYMRGASNNFDYELIASPNNQRKFDGLPNYIQKVLVRTKYSGYFNTDSKINLSNIS